MKSYIILIDHIPFFLIVFVDILRYFSFLLIWFGGAQYWNGSVYNSISCSMTMLQKNALSRNRCANKTLFLFAYNN